MQYFRVLGGAAQPAARTHGGEPIDAAAAMCVRVLPLKSQICSRRNCERRELQLTGVAVTNSRGHELTNYESTADSLVRMSL